MYRASSVARCVSHRRTSSWICLTKARMGSTYTSRCGVEPAVPAFSISRHSQGSTAANVFPAPVGARSDSGNGSGRSASTR